MGGGKLCPIRARELAGLKIWAKVAPLSVGPPDTPAEDARGTGCWSSKDRTQHGHPAKGAEAPRERAPGK